MSCCITLTCSRYFFAYDIDIYATQMYHLSRQIGSFKYSLHVIFISASSITICWCRSDGKESQRGRMKSASWIFSGWMSILRFFLSFLASLMYAMRMLYNILFSPKQKGKKVVVSRFNHELIYIILNNHERLAAFASVCADLGSLTITFLTNFSSRLPRECFYGYGLFWLCFFLPCTKLKRIFFSERDESKFVITTVTFYVHNLINTSLMLDLGTLVVIKLAANCYKN